MVLESVGRIGYLYDIYLSRGCVLSNLFYKSVQMFAYCVTEYFFSTVVFFSFFEPPEKNSAFC